MEKTAKGNRLARGERLQIMLDEHELRAVEDFRFPMLESAAARCANAQGETA